MKKFLLLDAHSLIFRAYFAFIKNPLRNSKGQNTSGIFGFLNSLKKIKSKFTTDCIALAFDAPGETFRDRAYKEYKATRPVPPRDIPFQIVRTKEIVNFLGIKIFEVPGYEADDILATLATRLQKHGEIYIVSSDKDLMQLISENVFIYDVFNDIVYDAEKVKEKFGIGPERIGEFLALCGDTIDNIPGVPGIGPHRALEILKKYPNLDEAIEKETKLKEHKDLILLSKKLVKLETDVPIEIKPEDLIIHNPDIENLLKILTELEFHSMIKEFAPKIDPRMIEKNRTLASKEIKDIVGIHIKQGEVFVSYKANEVSIIPQNQAMNILSDKTITKIGFDIKELLKICQVSPPFFDIKIAAWLIDPNIKHDRFEDICLKYLNSLIEPLPEIISNISFKLYPVLKKKLEELNEWELYLKIEEPLIPVLFRMEKRGIGIDIALLKELKNKIEKNAKHLADECYKIAGSVFNLNSPKQLADVLFGRLKLPPVKKGKSHFSTDAEVLQQLSLKHELPRKILEYRELAKITSTYIEPLIELAKSGRIHTTFNQTGTATGRLSSSNPNIQNIPIRSVWGNELRKAFVAKEGFLLISADYSQIELRILAHITGDKNLIDAFKSNRDIHNHTASLIFNTPEANVNDHQRRIAKVVNYGLIYGMSDYGLAQELGISKEEATQFIQTYYTLYPGVEEWRQSAIKNAQEKGYTETLFGRKRPVPEIGSDNYQLKEQAKRLAINTPIQGTAADLIKLAMIEVEKRLNEKGFSSGLLLSIHDELLFEIEEERISEAKKIISEAMTNIYEFSVPIEVNIGVGKNWAEVH
ncbi:MAG: DNA polymerase I [candidate division WOR-3 bacterium]|nr:DNA polymerase I [candidate division WOR-3 bacterium]